MASVAMLSTLVALRKIKERDPSVTASYETLSRRIRRGDVPFSVKMGDRVFIPENKLGDLKKMLKKVKPRIKR